MSVDTREYTLQLLADRATEGLSSDKQAELDRLLQSHPDIDELEFDLASAALELAFLEESVEMPANLKARVAKSLPAMLELVPPNSGTEGRKVTEPSRANPPAQPRKVTPITELPSRPDQGGLGRWMPWLVAAAAVLFAVMTGLNRGSNQDQAGNATPAGSPTEASPVTPTPDELRASLVAEATDLVQMGWTATEDGYATGAAGDVVWSDSRNEGYMRISGLHINDPSVDQYQLWVFDKSRDERYPVDGGVFDVAGGEVIIPIDPKVAVDEAFLFAVTVEKPGGVVVSDRERIVLLAQKS